MSDERIEEIRGQVREGLWPWRRQSRDIAMYLLSEVDLLRLMLEEKQAENDTLKAKLEEVEMNLDWYFKEHPHG